MASETATTAQWKAPPLIKVYEALGALGDRRVRATRGRAAEVTSSDGSRVYQVEVSDDGRQISSNDNASYWQGYLGYPAIAVLLSRGILRTNPDTARALAAIPWKELNSRFGNDYERTIAEVARTVTKRGYDFSTIEAEAEGILETLRELKPLRGIRRRPPREKP